MSDEDKDSKTEQASGKKLQEATERGQIAKSSELQVVCMLGTALSVLAFTLSSATRDIGALATNVFSQLATVTLRLDTVPTQMTDVVLTIGRILAPFLGACAASALLVGGIQSGFNLSPKVVGFNLDRLDPIAGFGRVFSKSAFVHALIDIAKVIAIGMILWVAAKKLYEDPMFSAPVEVGYLGEFLHRATLIFFARLLLVLGVVAAITYWYEWRKLHQDLMMTRQEVKEEQKQSEGDMQSKMAMRRMARRFMRKQMLAAVPTADVVITNPTHYAVALKYERGIDKAPVVLAKGENRFAMRIKELAAENGVPMVENRPVARALYALGEVGEVIPNELYQAVAEILAFVYRTNRYYFFRLKARRAEAARAAGAVV